jgi:hypothetical protein
VSEVELPQWLEIARACRAGRLPVTSVQVFEGDGGPDLHPTAFDVIDFCSCKGENEYCGACGGTGEIVWNMKLDPGKRLCDRCDGAGEVRYLLHCGRCHGLGQIPKR